MALKGGKTGSKAGKMLARTGRPVPALPKQVQSRKHKKNR